MDILLVDDEIYTIRVLKNAIHWEDCGVSHVYTALSAAKAREILREHPVELIICDIEMPQESGLELLEWIRKTELHTEVILLTCHTDFDYAKQAVRLGALDYCVKPVVVKELEAVIHKAAAQIQKKQSMEKALEDQSCLAKNKGVIQRNFWYRMLVGDYGGQAAEALKVAQDRGIFVEVDDLFGLALFSAKFEECLVQQRKQVVDWSREYFKDALVVLEGRAPSLWVMLVKNMDEERLNQLCQDYIRDLSIARNSPGLRLTGLFCGNIYFEELPAYYKKLQEQERMLTSYSAGMKNLRRQRASQEATLHIPPELEQLFYSGQFEKFEAAVETYLTECARKGAVSMQALFMLRADICQILDVYLKSRNISAHRMFSDERLCSSMNEAAVSVEHMLAFVRILLETVPRDENVTNITSAVKKYISRHLSENVTRGDIAAVLYMNEDYISRIFKRDTGLSIPQYLNKARIERAKELLVATDMSVGDVGEAVGYGNFSYFSKMFRQYENCTPREYALKYKGTV